MPSSLNSHTEAERALGASDKVADPVLVKSCLERIVQSAEFARSERMVSFLRFVVASALADRKDLLNERSIGRDVFGKPDDWDPSLDTIVRSEARRLRLKLGSYYERQGRNDPLRIDIPKGRYTPEFKIVAPLVQENAKTLAPELDIASPPTTHIPRRFHRALITVVLVAVTGTWLLVHHLDRPSSRDVEPAFTTSPFTTDLGKAYSPSISSDGKTVAYVWDNEIDPPDIYLRALDHPSSRRLDTVSGTRLFPSWSPDGKSIAFLESVGETVYVTVHSLQDGSEKRISRIAKQAGRWADDESPLLGDPGPVWTPDGQGLLISDHDAMTGSGGIFQVDLDGHRNVLVSTRGEDQYLYPRLSPDGTQLAYVRFSSHGVGDIFLVAKTGGPARELTFDKKTVRGLAWQPDGHSLLFSSNRSGSFQLWSANLGDGRLHPVMTNSSAAAEPAIASSGQWLVYVESNENWNIWRTPVADSPHGAAERLIASSGRNYDPRYSPDGGRIAFASDRSGSMELWVTDAENKNPQQLTHIGGPWLGGLSWSPRGDQIAFDARPEGRSAIFLIDANGGAPKPLERNQYEERMPTWSSDGKAIYFNSNRDGTIAIWKKSLVDGSTQRVSPHGMFTAAASKDDLLYSTRGGDLWSSALNGNGAKQLPDPLHASPVMSWYLQGQSIYLSQIDENGHDYRLLRYRSGRLTLLGTSHGMLVPNAPDIAVSPDEHWLVYARQDSSGSILKIRKLISP
jgi:Tol biopolymer transport system component